MLKFLAGPVLLGAGYIAGSVYGADAEQVVQKSPAETYAAVETALGNLRQSGTTFFDGGTPVSYELKVAHLPDRKLTVVLLFAGQEGAEVNLAFQPRSDGKETLIAAKIHGDHEVLRSVLGGTDKSRLAYAPDWMLNLSARPVLQQLASQIERGETAQFAGLGEGTARAQWEANLTSDEREQLSQWQQREATRPSVDPNADAGKFLAGDKPK